MNQVLLLRRLLVLILPWFTSAQNSSSTNISPFNLFVPDPFVFCGSTVWWEGRDVVPPFTLYMARGNGPIGRNNSLGIDILALHTNDTQGIPELDESYANTGEVVRFRVEDNNGFSAIAWSVADGSCDPIRTISKPEVTFLVTGDRTPATSLSTSNPTDQPLTPFPTKTYSSQGNTASSGGISTYSGGRNAISQGLPLVPQQMSEHLPLTNEEGSMGDEESARDRESMSAGETTTHGSVVNGGQTSQTSQIVAPNNGSGESDTTPGQTTLSTQSIGVITGTVVIAILLWVTALVWRWRYRRRPLALKPREVPHGGFMRELLSPTSAVPNYAHHSTVATVSATPRNQTQRQTRTFPPVEDERTTVPSYGEAIGLHLPPNALGVP